MLLLVYLDNRHRRLLPAKRILKLMVTGTSALQVLAQVLAHDRSSSTGSSLDDLQFMLDNVDHRLQLRGADIGLTDLDDLDELYSATRATG